MRIYLDASVLVALLTNDALTDRADAFLRSRTPVLIVSDFALAEFASAIARRVRTNELTAEEAATTFSTLDSWIPRATSRIEMVSADIRTAESYLRRLDLTLRAPDALNIAIARRVDAVLATFDDKMALCARKLGAEVAEA